MLSIIVIVRVSVIIRFRVRVMVSVMVVSRVASTLRFRARLY